MMFAILGTGITTTADTYAAALVDLADHEAQMKAAGGYSNAQIYHIDDVAKRLDGDPYIPAGVTIAPYDPTNIGAEIKRRRIRMGLTQAELAETSGTSQGRVGEYERGDREPTLKTLRGLASVLGPFEVRGHE